MMNYGYQGRNSMMMPQPSQYGAGNIPEQMHNMPMMQSQGHQVESASVRGGNKNDAS